MKKGMIVVLGMMAIGSAYANTSCAAAKTECHATEQDFATKLSENQRKIFNLMSAEQKSAVVTAAKDAANADAAVEKIMKEQNLALVNNELKVEKKS